MVFWDDEVRRFGVRVSPRGTKTYIVQYRTLQGRSRRLKIGTHGAWTPETARDQAKHMLREVDHGDDPAEKREEDRNAITVAQLCEEYFYKARRGHPYTLKRGGRPIKASTLDCDEGRCLRHVIPLLGKKLACYVTSHDVVRFIESVTEGKTAGVFKTNKPRGKSVVRGGEGAARRTVAMLSAIFSYAVKMRHCPSNPCRDVPRTRDKRKNIRLSFEDYTAFGKTIAAAEQAGVRWQFAAIARFLALTGLRRSEAIELRTWEVDFINRCLRLDDSKTGASVRPLGEPALRLLREIERPQGSYVFPSPVDPERFYNTFPSNWKTHVERLTPHWLRHGYASAAFELGCSETIVAHLLGHSVARTVTQGYIRAPDMMVQDAADRVASYIERAMAGEFNRVVPFDNRSGFSFGRV
jgi:integrase